jgi:hypothetical protein
MLHATTKALIDKLHELTLAGEVQWVDEGEMNQTSHTADGYKITLRADEHALMLFDAGGRDLETVGRGLLLSSTRADGRTYADIVDEIIVSALGRSRGKDFAISKLIGGLGRGAAVASSVAAISVVDESLAEAVDAPVVEALDSDEDQVPGVETDGPVVAEEAAASAGSVTMDESLEEALDTPEGPVVDPVELVEEDGQEEGGLPTEALVAGIATTAAGATAADWGAWSESPSIVVHAAEEQVAQVRSADAESSEADTAATDAPEALIEANGWGFDATEADISAGSVATVEPAAMAETAVRSEDWSVWSQSQARDSFAAAPVAVVDAAHDAVQTGVVDDVQDAAFMPDAVAVGVEATLIETPSEVEAIAVDAETVDAGWPAVEPETVEEGGAIDAAVSTDTLAGSEDDMAAVDVEQLVEETAEDSRPAWPSWTSTWVAEPVTHAPIALVADEVVAEAEPESVAVVAETLDPSEAAPETAEQIAEIDTAETHTYEFAPVPAEIAESVEEHAAGPELEVMAEAEDAALGAGHAATEIDNEEPVAEEMTTFEPATEQTAVEETVAAPEPEDTGSELVAHEAELDVQAGAPEEPQPEPATADAGPPPRTIYRYNPWM